jgi:putative ABC transport system permease protein
MDTLIEDLRFSLRTLARRPGFTAIAVLILGLAIGATTAIFSIVNAVILRPQPYFDPARLVAIEGLYQPARKPARVVPAVVADDVTSWRRESRTMESMAAFSQTDLPARTPNGAFSPVIDLVDPQFLDTLGILPMLGHDFETRDPNVAEPSIIITHKFWQQAFNGDPAVVGKTINLDGSDMTVIGVLPPTFQTPRSDASYFDRDADLIMLAKNLESFQRSFRNWIAVGRLRPGVTLAQAQSELQAIANHAKAGRLATQDDADWSVALDPLGKATAETSRQPLFLILGISIVLLLIACTNIMNLLFSRAAARAREMSVRKAVGASSGRLVRQLLTESACLALLAGGVGLLLAQLALASVVTLSPVHLPVSGTVHLDNAALLFTFGVCALAALVAGLFPAIHTSLQRENLARIGTARSTTGRIFANVQRGLAAAQMALGLGLLTAAGLLVHSLYLMDSVNPGFVRQGVVDFQILIPGDLKPPQIGAKIQSLIDQFRAIPGVTGSAYITVLPPELLQGVWGPFLVGESATMKNTPNPMFANSLIASDGYFRMMGIPVVQGRDFTPSDTVSGPKVMVVNQSLARKFFPKGNALGSRVRVMYDEGGPAREIVGIVKDTRDRGLGAPTVPTAYVPLKQFAMGYGGMLVRSILPPQQLIPLIREAGARVDSSIPLTDFETLNERIYESMREPRFYTVLATACALMAILFVTLGIYGLIANSVAQRTPEIGIRMALGANRSTILRMVLSQGLWLAAFGIVLGVGLSLAFTRLLQSLLFEVKPIDPLTLVASSLFLAAVTLVASLIPALRASRVDPMVALHYE